MKSVKKKYVAIVFFAVCFLVLALMISNINKVSAQIDVSNPASLLNLGSNNLPTTPEQAGSMAGTYLQGEWVKIINNTVVGKIHNYFLQHQLPFNILLKEDYSLSWFFFWVLVFWIFLWVIIYDILISAKLNKTLSMLLGLGAASGLAQLGFIRIVVNFLISIINKPESWWVKILVGVIIFFAFIIIKLYFGIIKSFFLSMWYKLWLKDTRKKAVRAGQTAEAAGELAGAAYAKAAKGEEGEEGVSKEEEEELEEEAEEETEDLGKD